MYIFTATLTEDLVGFTVSVSLIRVKGRKHEHVSEETWLLEAPFDDREVRMAYAEILLTQKVSELSEKLRRVASGVSHN